MTNEKKTQRIQGLDGLRGIAASIVLISHMSGWGYFLLPSIDINGTGRSGVLLFFVLSAFLLTSQVLSWSNTNLLTKSKWQDYAIARIFRILPLYLIVLVTALFTTYFNEIPIIWKYAKFVKDIPVPMSLDSFFEHILFIKGEDILWTIPVEIKFYFLLPPILIALKYIFEKNNINTIYIVSVFIVFDYIFLTNTADGTATLPFISVFMTGILIAILINKRTLKINNQALCELISWACIIVYILLIPSVFKKITTIDLPEAVSNSNVLYASLWAILIFTMLHGKGYIVNILESKFFVFLGTISFSLYLWHRVPIKLMHRLNHYDKINFIPDELKPIIIFIAAIIIAYISHRLIERPFLKLGNKLRKKLG